MFPKSIFTDLFERWVMPWREAAAKREGILAMDDCEQKACALAEWSKNKPPQVRTVHAPALCDTSV